jgi:uncharacterized protein YjbI with pentapeptide repeats
MGQSLSAWSKAVKDIKIPDLVLDAVRIPRLTLHGVSLTNAIMEKTEFFKNHWDAWTLEACRLNGCKFVDCRFDDCQITFAHFSGVEYQDCIFVGTTWEGQRFSATFKNCTITDCIFAVEEMDSCCFESCELDNVDFSHSEMKGVAFNLGGLSRVKWSLRLIANVAISTTIFRDGANALAIALDLLPPLNADCSVSIQQATGIDESSRRKLKDKGVSGKF